MPAPVPRPAPEPMAGIHVLGKDADGDSGPRIFRGLQRIDHVPPDDRGLAYGDGVFETMRGFDGVLPWWSRHWQRLQRGAQRLRLSVPPERLVRTEAERMLGSAEGVIKLLLTRGSGGRGYMPPDSPDPVWILTRHPVPAPMPSVPLVRWCQTRLSLQSALAGIKHCNRLEQVLARVEWSADSDHAGEPAGEGLMCSTEGDVVCATAANLFVLDDGRWRTSLLDRNGVEGTMREWVLGQVQVEQARLTVAEVESADAIVLTNAVRGILQVACLGGRQWQPHPAVHALRCSLAAAHPAFSMPPSGPDLLELS